MYPSKMNLRNYKHIYVSICMYLSSSYFYIPIYLYVFLSVCFYNISIYCHVTCIIKCALYVYKDAFVAIDTSISYLTIHAFFFSNGCLRKSLVFIFYNQTSRFLIMCSPNGFSSHLGSFQAYQTHHILLPSKPSSLIRKSRWRELEGEE